MSKRNKNQGTKYENQTIEHFGLTPHEKERGNTNLPDASLRDYLLELKSCNISLFHDNGKKRTPEASTGRDLGPKKIEAWRKMAGFIFAGHMQGQIVKYLFLTQREMKPFLDELEELFNTGRKKGKGKYLGGKLLSVIDNLLDSQEAKIFIKKQLSLRKNLEIDAEMVIQQAKNNLARGAKLNDPKWNWNRLVEAGRFIQTQQDILEILENE